MKIFLKIFIIVFNTLIIFLISDLTFSNLIIKGSEQKQKNIRVFNEFYHHDFKPNVNQKLSWGGNFYNICTNQNAFLVSCNKNNNENIINTYDTLFIGDSMTEGLGYSYDQTFVGIFEKNKKKKISNLAVLSYSPFLYYQKIKYILSKGIKFNHLVVLIDISDLEDDMNYLNIEAKFALNKVPHKLFEKEEVKKNNFRDFLNRTDWNLRNILARNFLISYNLYTEFKKYYFKNFIKDKDLYFNNISWMDYDNKRVNWSYDNNFPGFTKNGIDSEINFTVSNMQNLWELLNQNSIDLSVAVYPLPQSLYYETNNSRYVSTWKNFCIDKCKNFVNLFDIFKKETNYFNTYNKYYIFNDVHFNKFSHQIVGNYLSKVLN